MIKSIIKIKKFVTELKKNKTNFKNSNFKFEKLIIRIK